MFGADVCDCFCFMSNCVWLQHQNDVKNVRSLALTLLVLLEVLWSEEKRLLHTPTEWLILFGLFVEPRLGCAGVLCRFLWWKTQAMPDSEQYKEWKKGRKACARTGGRGAREIWVQEFRGCGFMARMTRQIESIFAAEKKLLCCCTKPVFQLLLLWTTAANQDFWTLSTNWSCRLYGVRYSTNKDGESGSYVCPHWSWAAMQEASVYNELSMNTITVWRISIIICLFCANRWREKVGGFDFFSK